MVYEKNQMPSERVQGFSGSEWWLTAKGLHLVMGQRAQQLTNLARLGNRSTTPTSWDGTTLLGCRSQVIREFYNDCLALMFRLTQRRFIVGYALGDDGMLFRGELLTNSDDERARQEALALAEYWSEIDAEDEADRGMVSQTRVIAQIGSQRRKHIPP